MSQLREAVKSAGLTLPTATTTVVQEGETCFEMCLTCLIALIFDDPDAS